MSDRPRRQTRPFQSQAVASDGTTREVPPPSQALMDHLWEQFETNPIRAGFSGQGMDGAVEARAVMASCAARLELLTYLQNLADNQA